MATQAQLTAEARKVMREDIDLLLIRKKCEEVRLQMERDGMSESNAPTRKVYNAVLRTFGVTVEETD